MKKLIKILISFTITIVYINFIIADQPKYIKPEPPKKELHSTPEELQYQEKLIRAGFESQEAQVIAKKGLDAIQDAITQKQIEELEFLKTDQATIDAIRSRKISPEEIQKIIDQRKINIEKEAKKRHASQEPGFFSNLTKKIQASFEAFKQKSTTQPKPETALASRLTEIGESVSTASKKIAKESTTKHINIISKKVDEFTRQIKENINLITTTLKTDIFKIFKNIKTSIDNAIAKIPLNTPQRRQMFIARGNLAITQAQTADAILKNPKTQKDQKLLLNTSEAKLNALRSIDIETKKALLEETKKIIAKLNKLQKPLSESDAKKLSTAEETLQLLNRLENLKQQAFDEYDEIYKKIPTILPVKLHKLHKELQAINDRIRLYIPARANTIEEKQVRLNALIKENKAEDSETIDTLKKEIEQLKREQSSYESVFGENYKTALDSMQYLLKSAILSKQKQTISAEVFKQISHDCSALLESYVTRIDETNKQKAIEIAKAIDTVAIETYKQAHEELKIELEEMIKKQESLQSDLRNPKTLAQNMMLDMQIKTMRKKIKQSQKILDKLTRLGVYPIE